MPPEMMKSLVEDRATIDDVKQPRRLAEAPEAEEAQEAQRESEWEEPEISEEQFDEFELLDDDEADNFTDAVEDMFTGDGEEPLGEADAVSLADFLVELTEMGKDALSDFYEDGFTKKAKRRWGPDKKAHLLICDYALEKTDGKRLNVADLKEIKEALAQADPRFDVDLMELLEVGIEYKRLRRHYRAKPLTDSQREGLRKYTQATIKKYFIGYTPDPLAMLLLYVGAIFTTDAIQLFQHFRNDREE